MYTVSATPVLLAPQIATKWCFRQADGVWGGVYGCCATNDVDVSDEWLIEGVLFMRDGEFPLEYL